MTRKFSFTRVLIAAGCTALFSFATPAMAQVTNPRQGFSEPVYRVATTPEIAAEQVAEHPLDPLLIEAQRGYEYIRDDIEDYTAILVKRERVDGELQDAQYMFVKVRNEQRENGQITVPFGVYIYWQGPAELKGQEVMWVENENDNKLRAHPPQPLLPNVWLRPDGPIATRGNRYPITEMGIETLMFRLLEKGQVLRRFPEVEIETYENTTINNRQCTCYQISHTARRPEFDFQYARLFIDDELGVPIRFESYDWPAEAGGQPQLLEEYTYLNLQLNVGLTDNDFDINNDAYELR